MSNKIRIGAIDYRVESVKGLIRDDGEELLGLARYWEERILVDDDLPPQVTRITIMHEVIHGILTAAGASNQPEDLVNAICHGLITLERDNPDLIRIDFSKYLE